jgi:ankyrin repeat protein
MTLTTCIEKSLNLTRLDNPVQPSYSEDVKTACLQSLSFRNIDSRRHDIASAHQNTCDWLFATAQFQQWQNRGDPKSYNGVLWIKGKPGAGKSTLMKHALLHYQNSFSGHAVAAYFFNARGDALEKSPLGMLRSVLYQLLEQTPQSCNRFIPLFLEKQRKHGKDWMWYSEELKGFLLEMMHHQPRPILLFVDALDECDESEVRDVVSFLERLSLAAIGSETSLGICLSSRHYPTISMGKMLELVVEQRAEHDRDISIYVQDKLKMRDETTESELLQKANGIFMWIILVTEMLNQAIDEGRITAMRKKLREVPGDLDEVFRILLEKDNPYKHETILILQWVLFAKRPLKPKELYFAVIAGTEPEGFEPWCLSKVTNQTVRRFITTSSRGLIEIRENDFSRTTQFIHESVNDFLLRNRRLQTLDPTLAPHIVGTSHNRLANCCLSHIEMELLDPSARIVSYELDQKYPFLRYASAHMLHHAEQAHTGRITQPALSQRLQHESDLFERFKSFHNSFERTSMTYGKEVKLLYVVSLEKCRGLAQTILLEPSIDVNAQGGHYGNALQAAAATRDGGHFVSVATVKEIIQILLDAGADVDAQGGHYGNALQAAADNQFSPTNTNNEIIQVLLDAGADVNAQGGYYGNALQAATTHPNFAAEKVIKMLLDAGADVNAQGGYYGNALQAATNGAARSHSTKEVTQMLLDAGADVNAQGGYHGNALQAAVAATGSHFGYATAAKEVVQMLLDAGADANAQGGRYGNVLQAAAAAAADSEFTASYSNGYNLVVKEVIQMLLDAGANVNAQGGHYGNVLQATAAIIPAGHSGYITVAKEVIQMLLDAGADVNAQGGYYGNALQAAAAPGGGRTSYTTAAKDIIQMLLDAGADVNSQGGHYGNALQAAAAAAKPSFAAKEIIQIFLDARADVNAQGGYYGNALQAADAVATAAATWPVSAPDKGIVQMLLDAGAVDVNDQDEDCSNTDTV